MDEACIARPKNRGIGGQRHLRGMSDDMAGKNRDGTWEALAGPEPNTPNGKSGEEPSYKETKEREAGRVADGVEVLMMGMRHNIPGGKDSCCKDERPKKRRDVYCESY